MSWVLRFGIKETRRSAPTSDRLQDPDGQSGQTETEPAFADRLRSGFLPGRARTNLRVSELDLC
jgi:hypothetical protein